MDSQAVRQLWIEQAPVAQGDYLLLMPTSNGAIPRTRLLARAAHDAPDWATRVRWTDCRSARDPVTVAMPMIGSGGHTRRFRSRAAGTRTRCSGACRTTGCAITDSRTNPAWQPA